MKFFLFITFYYNILQCNSRCARHLSLVIESCWWKVERACLCGVCRSGSQVVSIKLTY